MGMTQTTGGHATDIWSDVPALLAAAHELKSPLVLMRQLALQLEDESTSVIAERIRLTAEQSLRLVEDLTRVVRLDDALFELEPINLGVFYDDIAHELTPLATALDQRIEVRQSQRSLLTIGNRSLLRSILLGLCDNALTHNDRRHPVRLSARRQGNMIISQVRDHGPRTNQLQSVRRSLGTSVQPLAARPRSSGLGLMIASRFAVHMNAELSLIRHRQAGATFALSLPASHQLALFDTV